VQPAAGAALRRHDPDELEKLALGRARQSRRAL